jgi:FkbM family methyltransferase
MKHKIKVLLKLISYYGVWHGLKLQLQLLTGNTNSIKLPPFQHAFSLRKNTSDNSTFEQVFLNDEYNLNFIKDPKVIIDGGANIGLFAIQMKKQFPDAQIISIEPDPENFQLLQKNLKHYQQITFENAGLWNKDTQLKVYDKYNCGKWGMVVEEDLLNGTIKAMSIDTLIDKYKIDTIDVLKIDIETSEKQLFSSNFENWLPKTKVIIIELHDRMEPGCAKSFFMAINKCYTNYTYSTLGENIIITNLDKL